MIYKLRKYVIPVSNTKWFSMPNSGNSKYIAGVKFIANGLFFSSTKQCNASADAEQDKPEIQQ